MVPLHSRKFPFAHWLSGTALAGVTLISSFPVVALQTAATAATPEPPAAQTHRPQWLAQGLDTTSLSIAGGERLRDEARAAVANQDYELAIAKLNEARTTFNDLSRYYKEIAGLFLGIDTQVNESNRAKALEAAQLRDETSYELAVIYRSQGQPDQAVPLLMEILNSQQPTRALGQQAYQQLYELGFVDQPYIVGGTVDDAP